MKTTHTTNYYNTFIAVAEDCPATMGEVPQLKAGTKSIANLEFELMSRHPYAFTSDDILFQVFAERNQLDQAGFTEARAVLFSKGQACLRSSALGKRYGWGIHFNEEGKVALFGREQPEYQQLARDTNLKQLKAMRSKRSK
ncbi:hypothetical protein EXU57_19240 [Segetibacter sp. 3557_3]|uniref:DUF6157 family protein n=1 Tax=Segetibacter sp. 3557_3 TaxID=2547429 RepID=UPI001058894A|nr:DUF6157 family protein [Segetibacter sp. 3557_3]TDH21638.1 hypothetical protein EXU57_19240 [Segetibacter sp. 3557_3]